MASKLWISLVVASAMIGITFGAGQLCYTCVSQGGDTSCLDDPAGVPGGIKACKYDFCTIRRQESPDNPGKSRNAGLPIDQLG